MIELLVVVLVIGILAAIAIPTFLGQKSKAQDAGAKSDVKTVVLMVEECNLEEKNYTKCDEASELDGAPGISWGSGPGQAGVYDDDTSADEFYAYGVSQAKSGKKNHVFIWQHNADGSVDRYCTTSARPRSRGGCLDGSW